MHYLQTHNAIQDQLNLASSIVPPSALDIIRGEIARIAANSDGRLTMSFLGGLALSLWSANAAIKALFEALNIVYAEEEKRGVVSLNLFSLFLTICGIAGALLVVGSVVVLPLALATVGFPSLRLMIIAYARWFWEWSHWQFFIAMAQAADWHARGGLPLAA
jgi:membrane protein